MDEDGRRLEYLAPSSKGRGFYYGWVLSRCAVIISFNNVNNLKGKETARFHNSADFCDIDVTSPDNFSAIYCSYTINIPH